jgi:hypothetical protein
MESNSPQGKKVPLIFIGVAVLVIAAGVFVRSRNSSSSEPTPEPAPALANAPAPEPAPVLTPELAPMPAKSPEPSQRIRFSSLAASDKNGDNWTLGLAGVPQEPPQDGTRPGAPIIVKADVHAYGQSISIGLIIQGQAGEVYQPGAAKNGRRRPAPTFRVFDESGKILGSGSFEYG